MSCFLFVSLVVGSFNAIALTKLMYENENRAYIPMLVCIIYCTYPLFQVCKVHII